MSASEIRNWLNLFESVILTELTDKVKQQQFDRLKRENTDTTSDISDDDIKMYINIWDEYSQGFPPQFKDITKLSLEQIISLIKDADFKKYLRGKPNRFFADQEPNPDLDTLYNKNNLTIMKGDLREKCIRYGEGYSWCISRKDAQNLFFSYRMRLEEPMFYFVFDKDKSKNDKYHAMVIYVDNNRVYNVASAENTGDVEMSWDEIITVQPKLSGLQGIFKHQPLSKEEKSDYDKFKNKVNDQTYDKFSLEEKYKYIKTGHKLTPYQQDLTPDDLIGVYAKLMPSDITNDTWKRLKSGDQRKIISDVIDENNNIDAVFFQHHVLKKPWHMSGLPDEIVRKAHNKIAKSGSYKSYTYARYILLNNDYNQKLIPQEILKGITNNAENSYEYATIILNRTDYTPNLIPPEIETSIASNPDYSYYYARYILGNDIIKQDLIPQEILSSISSEPKLSYGYAKDILQNNDYNQDLIPPEIITGIASSAEHSSSYAIEIIDPSKIPQEIIDSIATDTFQSLRYAIEIVEYTDFDPKLIPQEIITRISKSANHSFRYAEMLLQNNKYDQTLIPPEIISTIKSDSVYYDYYKELISQQNESTDLTRLKHLSGIL